MKGGEIMRCWLIDKRNQLGITQKELAVKLGVSQQYVSLIENGNRQSKITADLLCKLSSILSMPIEQIIKSEQL